MPRWIVEDPSTVYFLLGIAALVFGVLLWIRQERKWLYGLGAVAVLAALVALLDYLIVTDFERMQLHVKDMAGAVATKDVDRIFSHISPDFRKGGADKKLFRGLVQQAIKSGEVTELAVWEFERGDFAPDNKHAKVLFLVKGRGPHLGQKEYLRCVATFVLEPDGQWRMTTYELTDPITAKGEPIDIPGLPR